MAMTLECVKCPSKLGSCGAGEPYLDQASAKARKRRGTAAVACSTYVLPVFPRLARSALHQTSREQLLAIWTKGRIHMGGCRLAPLLNTPYVRLRWCEIWAHMSLSKYFPYAAGLSD